MASKGVRHDLATEQQQMLPKKIREKEKKSWKLKSRIADIENTRISLEYKVEQNKKGGKSELKHKKSTVTDEEVHYQEKKK